MNFMKRHWIKLVIIAGLGAFTFAGLNSCTSVPEGIEPVKGFNQKKYLGKWYEIARLDHRFERGLSNVSAEYSVRDDGGIKVLNRGYKDEKGKWNDAEGKAFFVDSEDKAHLKVSFFGPFYGSYVVFDLDDDYQRSYITSSSRDYLWFLSRTPTITEKQKQDFLKKTKNLGFDTDALIWVDQKKNTK